MKNKTTAGLLALFLGGCGAHHFYLGNNKKGLTCLLVSFLLFGVGPIVIGIKSIIDAISYFSMSEQDFEELCQNIQSASGQTSSNNVSALSSKEKAEIEKYRKLKEFKELLDMGAISEEEFIAIKTKILN